MDLRLNKHVHSGRHTILGPFWVDRYLLTVYHELPGSKCVFCFCFFDYVKFAMPLSLRLTIWHWWIYNTQPGAIACTITKGLSHSTARAEQREYAALYLYQLLGLVML